jgi:SRSO17 transposase
VEGCRWAIEDGFETAKTELGLDHNETRSWHGWHRHVSLVMLAFAMLATIRHRANRGREKNQRPTVRRQNQNYDPLVGAGDSSHRHAPGATAY